MTDAYTWSSLLFLAVFFCGWVANITWKEGKILLIKWIEITLTQYLVGATRIAASCRTSRQEVFCENGVLKDFAKFTGKCLCQSLFFNKVAGLRPPTLLKKRLWYKCFPVNFAKFLITPLFTEHLQWLLLTMVNLRCLLYCKGNVLILKAVWNSKNVFL